MAGKRQSQPSKRIAQLMGNDPLAGNQAVEFYAARGARALDRMLPLIGHYPWTEQRLHRLPRLFGRIGEAAVVPLTRLIKEGEWHEKASASECFRELPRRASEAALAPLLEASDPDLVRCAIEALGHVGADGWGFKIQKLTLGSRYTLGKYRHYALQAFTRFIARETSQHNVTYDLTGLEQLIKAILKMPEEDFGDTRDDESIDAQDLSSVEEVFEELTPVAADTIIHHWLSHRDPLFRKLGAEALAATGLRRAVPHLAQHLFDETEAVAVRRECARALGRIGGIEAARVVRRAFEQFDPAAPAALRGAIHFALSALLYHLAADKPLEGPIRLLLEGEPEVQAQTIYALGFVGPDGEAVSRALHSQTPLVRAAAALTTARLEGKQSRTRLLTVANEAADPLERALVLSALVRAGAANRANDLHAVLCDLPGRYPVSQFRRPWQREILWALTQGSPEGRLRAEAWADLMRVDFDRSVEELDSLTPPVEKGKAQEPIAAPRQDGLDVLIVTALLDELDAVLALTDDAGAEGWTEGLAPDRLPYHHRKFRWNDGTQLRIAAAWSGKMGETATAVRAGYLCDHLKPSCLAMCGICAGRRDYVFLGDVIVAERIYSYDHGKLIATSDDQGRRMETFFQDITTYNLEDEWQVDANYFSRDLGWSAELVKTRPISRASQRTWVLHRLYEHAHQPETPHPIDHPNRKRDCPAWTSIVERLITEKLVRISGGVLQLSKKGKDLVQQERSLYPDGLPSDPPFRVHVGPVATGKTVRLDPELFSRLERLVQKTIGVEMEGAAVGYLGQKFRRKAIVVKGVSDYGDAEKDDTYRKFAAEASARCLLAFLRRQLGRRTPNP